MSVIRRRRPGARRRRLLLTTAGTALLAVLAAACASSGGGGGSGTSSSGPDLSYFKGKTITLIAPDNPGGSFDEWSRLMAPLMGKYLGATVNVENIPAGNTVVGQNTLASSQANGLTIGWLNADEDISFGISGGGGANINFNPTDVSMIAAPGQSIQSWVTQPSSAYTSFQALASSTQTIPTLSVTSGTATLFLRSVFGAYGIKAKYITGYESSKLLAAGFLRKDGPVAEEEFTVFQNAITAGEARPVLISNAPPAGDPATKSLANVPTVAQIAQSDPPKTAAGKAALQEVVTLTNLPGTILAAAKGTPAGEVSALEAAAKSALTNATLEKQAEVEGLGPGFATGAACLAGYKSALKNINVLKPYMTAS